MDQHSIPMPLMVGQTPWSAAGPQAGLPALYCIYPFGDKARTTSP